MTNQPSSAPLQPLPDDWQRALFVVAHPDDVEFGSAGAVAAWVAAGKSVAYLHASCGEAGMDGMDPEQVRSVRMAEQRAAGAVVGVTEVEFLDHPDGVIEYGVPLRRDLAAAIRRHRPDFVLGFNHHESAVHGGWNSADHRNTGRALLDAVQDAANRWIFPEVGEPWSGVKYTAMGATPVPTHAVDITGHTETAWEALLAHKEYLANLTLDVDLRSGLDELYRRTGTRFGERPSVGFELIRV